MGGTSTDGGSLSSRGVAPHVWLISSKPWGYNFYDLDHDVFVVRGKELHFLPEHVSAILGLSSREARATTGRWILEPTEKAIPRKTRTVRANTIKEEAPNAAKEVTVRGRITRGGPSPQEDDAELQKAIELSNKETEAQKVVYKEVTPALIDNFSGKSTISDEERQIILDFFELEMNNDVVWRQEDVDHMIILGEDQALKFLGDQCFTPEALGGVGKVVFPLWHVYH
ncbi:hypothetical protein QJS10_CPA16g00630 [Acorus calamus]|uniref:Uncharacterized protein n=1 Tax=Acorus calamus TaxID=4465 RepID=A0AAV9CY49_ACOCL|nr:hypothetical protein QJS10_CPA16g00630 [Acorus calamus]